MPAGLQVSRNVTSRIASKITTSTVNLTRVSAGMRKTILRDLEKLEADLVYDLMRAAGKSELTKARLSALLAQTRETINTAYAGISVGVTPQLQEIAIKIAKQTAAAVNGVVRVELMTVALTQKQLEFIAGKTVIEGQVQAKWWKTQATTVRNKFAAQMRQGQYRGEGVDQLVRRVRGTKALNYTDAIMTVPKHQAEALVRTSVISVANESRLATYIENKDVIRGVQWVATLEGACEECAELDGKIWTLPESGDKDGDYEPEGHDIPFPGSCVHFACRCSTAPVTFSFEELAQKEMSEQEPE